MCSLCNPAASRGQFRTSITCKDAGFSIKAKSASAPAKAGSTISGVVTGGFAEASSQASAPISGQIHKSPCSTCSHAQSCHAPRQLRFHAATSMGSLLAAFYGNRVTSGQSPDNKTLGTDIASDLGSKARTKATHTGGLKAAMESTCDGCVCSLERLLFSTVASASGPTAWGLQLQRPSWPPLKPQPW